jgi:hypothetical protein
MPKHANEETGETSLAVKQSRRVHRPSGGPSIKGFLDSKRLESVRLLFDTVLM